MPREFKRSDRVASQLQREIADLIRTQVKEPRLGMVTVSDAEVSRDLAVAKVFVTFLGATEPVETCLSLLSAKAPMLRRELSKRLHIRNMPEIRFVFDDSIERGMRIDALLNQLRAESKSEE
ncbi:30S ribosome-binding factor RbfA [Methylocaldum szegediense]|jgi:ribosome-binding factor A|uniref:Ribosome-binding factor A n=1 Tax=Methylocaldum szegediense TaxID=73780 RepID=A0ABN8WXE0_9GAMM|nr:30S ribosome-binding factor RbfA [Methylocaldum szegediense]CAI8742711.1 30S ribosome binding factor [Methylocaldum szegediense]